MGDETEADMIQAWYDELRDYPGKACPHCNLECMGTCSRARAEAEADAND